MVIIVMTQKLQDQCVQSLIVQVIDFVSYFQLRLSNADFIP